MEVCSTKIKTYYIYPKTHKSVFDSDIHLCLETCFKKTKHQTLTRQGKLNVCTCSTMLKFV